MTDRRELVLLAGRIAAWGGMAELTDGPDGFIESVSVHGCKGIGPHPMTPIAAAERMREWLAERDTCTIH